MILSSNRRMGRYGVEVRRESFYLRGEGVNAIHVYPDQSDPLVGTVEIALRDIPKIRAALDLVEKHVTKKK